MPNREDGIDHRAALLEQTIHKVLDEREQRSSSLFVRGPGGWMIGAKGKTAAVVVVGAALAVGLYLHDKREMAREEKAVLEHARQVEAVREMTFVLTLDENQRKRLELQMPDSLRQRLNGRQPTP